MALARAREHLRDEHPDWGILWNALWKTAPGDSVMEQAAHKWLANPAAQLTRQWSPVWQALFEYCFKRNHIADPELLSAGLAWLNAMQFEPDWNYVFRAIANHAPDQAPLELAMRVMRQPENTNWAFVCDAATHLHVKLNREERVEIHRLAANWLEKREDRDEWAYVWARLVESRADLGAADVELGELLKRGYEWLEKREERDARRARRVVVCVGKAGGEPGRFGSGGCGVGRAVEARL